MADKRDGKHVNTKDIKTHNLKMRLLLLIRLPV